LFELVNWMYTNSDAHKRAIALGYTVLPKNVQDIVFAHLDLVTCQGNQLIGLTVVQDRQTGGYLGIFIVAMCFFAFTVIFAIPLFVMREKKQHKSGVYYASVILLGGVMSYVSIVFWWLLPDQDYVCQLRQWLTGLGLCIIFSGLFARLWQIQYIYYQVHHKKELSIRVLSTKVIFIASALIILLQIILLVIWSSVDTWKSRLAVSDSLRLEAKWECHSNDITVWLALEAAYFAVLLLYGLFVVYSTWKIRSSVTEARWVLIAIYNTILCLAIEITLLQTLYIDDDTIFYLAVIPLVFVVVSLSAAIFAPKFFQFLKAATSSSFDRKKTSEKTSRPTTGGGHTSSPDHEVDAQEPPHSTRESI